MHGDEQSRAGGEAGDATESNAPNGRQSEREAALERRLQILIEAEQGARDQLQAEADRRIEEARRVLDETRADSEREREERSAMEHRLEEQRLRTKEREAELQDAQGQIDSFRREVELLRAELEQARAGMDSRDELLQQLEGTKRKLEKARAEIHRKDEELLASERSVTEARREVEHELRERREVEKTIEGIKAQASRGVADARTRVEEELRVRMEAEKQLARALAEGERLASALDAARGQVERTEQERDEAVGRARKQREEMAGEVDRSAKEAAMLARRLESAAEWEQGARAENERIKEELKDAKERLDGATQQVSALERSITEARQTEERQRNEWRLLRDRHAKDRTELESKVNELQAAEAHSRDEVQRMSAEVKQLGESLAAAERRATKANQAVEDERKQRSEIEHELAKVIGDASHMEKNVAVVEQRIAEALDRRLKATIEAETQTRDFIQRHAAAIEARKAELAELDNRIGEARGVLVEAQAAATRQREERAELEERVKMLGSSQDAPAETPVVGTSPEVAQEEKAREVEADQPQPDAGRRRRGRPLRR